jgi:nucleoside-diphosphate-sugar epimerase
MKILVLGGTAWLGHHIAATAISRGHDVTCLARGSGAPEGARLVNADRDDDDALSILADDRWDAVVDVARQPGHVRRAVRDLEARADRFIFVSTGNVYLSQEAIGVDETAELNAPLHVDHFDSPDDYGPAKVACENAVLDAFGTDRTLIARAGLIGGPDDPTGRTTYWPWRFAHPAVGGAVLVPDAPDLPTSVIDVRDLAEWLVRCAETGTSGVFNAMGLSTLFPDHIAAAREAAESDTQAVAAPEGWLLDKGVSEWAGDRSLPLWLSDKTWYGMGARSVSREEAAGLTFRPLVETLRDGLRSRVAANTQGAGLSDVDERELLQRLRNN